MKRDGGLVVRGDGWDATGAEGTGLFRRESFIGVFALVVVDEGSEGQKGEVMVRLAEGGGGKDEAGRRSSFDNRSAIFFLRGLELAAGSGVYGGLFEKGVGDFGLIGLLGSNRKSKSEQRKDDSTHVGMVDGCAIWVKRSLNDWAWFDSDMRKKILLSWSGGKDSAWTLHMLRQQRSFSEAFEVVGLLTTVNEKFGRVAIHGFREELLERQALAASLPLWKVPLPFPCSNEEYEARMAVVCESAVQKGFAGIAFGDLFLEEIRSYREAKLRGTGLEPVFPLWGIPTDELAAGMMAGGLRARLTCVDPRKVPAEYAGREWDAELLRQLPAGIDPCGENGEFHSFAYAGPMFRGMIPVITGERVERDGFVYADLMNAEDVTHRSEPVTGRA